MRNVHELSDYARGTMPVAVGRNGNQQGTVQRRILLKRLPGGAHTVILLPRKRRIGRLGPAKVLDFPTVI